jgi:hypothetical protein
MERVLNRPDESVRALADGHGCRRGGFQPGMAAPPFGRDLRVEYIQAALVLPWPVGWDSLLGVNVCRSILHGQCSCRRASTIIGAGGRRSVGGDASSAS